MAIPADRVRGYHKPIMIAGGLGNVRRNHVEKCEIPVGTKIVVLGGPAMLIGLGGGAASSMGSGASSADLDFASVQRGNPEIQRRAQEVIDRCSARWNLNPILLIHDVGAGGLSNAVPEAVAHTPGRGARIDMARHSQRRARHVADGTVVQRIAGALRAADRCRAPRRFRGDRAARALPVRRARRHRRHRRAGARRQAARHTSGRPAARSVVRQGAEDVARRAPRHAAAGARCRPPTLDLREAAYRLLRFPAVADKTFLISIGDRTVGGMISRDQMVGPWQVPVADVAVTIADYFGHAGEAMSMGERTPVAVLDAPASGRLAVGEALTNILAADIGALSNVKLSANWMAACGEPGEDAALYATVRTVGEELCPALGIAIPVGKDSLSMKTVWGEAAQRKSVVAPVSLIISAFAPVGDVRKTWTPQLRTDLGATVLLLVDLGKGANRLGGSALAQVFGELGSEPADLASPALLTQLASALAELRAQNLVLAYHDRSDGGVFATLVEMAFAGHCGLDIKLPCPRMRRRHGRGRRAVLRRARRRVAGEGRTRRRGALGLRAARPGRLDPRHRRGHARDARGRAGGRRPHR